MRAPSRRTTTRSAGTAVAGLLILASAGVAAQAATSSRLGGAERFETATKISQAVFPPGNSCQNPSECPDADSVILARADLFPDAMASAALAGDAQGPILLTETDKLNESTAKEIERLDPATIYLAGGQAAISTVVEAEVRARFVGKDVKRIGGQDRYETAQLIAQEIGRADIGTLGTSGRTAILAKGTDFPDALTGGSIAHEGTFPTLLTPPNTLSDSARAALDGLDIELVILLGGEAAMSSQVNDQIKAMGISTVRIAGADRADTAAKIADFGVSQLGFPAEEAVLARGDLFPDALSGGPYAGVNESPILLARTPGDLGPAADGWLKGHADTLNKVTALGGQAAISDATLAQATASAG